MGEARYLNGEPNSPALTAIAREAAAVEIVAIRPSKATGSSGGAGADAEAREVLDVRPAIVRPAIEWPRLWRRWRQAARGEAASAAEKPGSAQDPHGREVYYLCPRDTSRTVKDAAAQLGQFAMSPLSQGATPLPQIVSLSPYMSCR
jgi:hypothetical protein